MHDVVPAEKSFTKVTLPLGSRVFSVWIRVLLFWGPIKTPAESERTVSRKSNIDFNTVCYARVNCETFLFWEKHPAAF